MGLVGDDGPCGLDEQLLLVVKASVRRNRKHVKVTMTEAIENGLRRLDTVSSVKVFLERRNQMECAFSFLCRYHGEVVRQIIPMHEMECCHQLRYEARRMSALRRKRGNGCMSIVLEGFCVLHVLRPCTSTCASNWCRRL